MQDTQHYELINPIAEIYFEAPNAEVAACVVFLISNGKFGADPIESDGQNVPVFNEGGGLSWFQETFGRGFDVSLQDNLQAISDAMLSFGYAGQEDLGQIKYTEEDICLSAYEWGIGIAKKHSLMPWCAVVEGDDDGFAALEKRYLEAHKAGEPWPVPVGERMTNFEIEVSKFTIATHFTPNDKAEQPLGDLPDLRRVS